MLYEAAVIISCEAQLCFILAVSSIFFRSVLYIQTHAQQQFEKGKRAAIKVPHMSVCLEIPFKIQLSVIFDGDGKLDHTVRSPLHS